MIKEKSKRIAAALMVGTVSSTAARADCWDCFFAVSAFTFTFAGAIAACGTPEPFQPWVCGGAASEASVAWVAVLHYCGETCS